MAAILAQLGIDETFFTQLIIFAILFLALAQVYFKPFLKLFEARHRSTVEDREAAEKLLAQANAKLEEYKSKLADERATARREFEAVLSDARREEATLLARAREEAKKITQDAAESVAAQKDQLRRQLEVDVESLARVVSEKLVSRKV